MDVLWKSLNRKGEDKMKRILVCMFLVLFVMMASTAFADDNRFDRRGDRIDHRLDRKGDRIDNRLDHKGDRIDHRLDRKGDRINRRLSRRGN